MSQPYKRRSEAVWAQVRAEYLAGATAEACARRYDVTVATIAWRARNHGWRKVDKPAPLAGYPPFADGGGRGGEPSASSGGEAGASGIEAGEAAGPLEPPPASPGEAAHAAFRAAARALMAGRPAESQAFARLADSMGRLSLPPEPGSAPKAKDQAATVTATDPALLAMRKKVEGLIDDKARWLAVYMMTGGSVRPGAPGEALLPEYAIGRDGRIVRTADIQGVWFDTSVSEPPAEGSTYTNATARALTGARWPGQEDLERFEVELGWPDPRGGEAGADGAAEPEEG